MQQINRFPRDGLRSGECKPLPALQLQFNLFDDLDWEYSSDVADAVETLAMSDRSKTRGAIYTRSEVVDFILDLAGYTTDQPLHIRRLLEPSFGGGDFLLPIEPLAKLKKFQI